MLLPSLLATAFIARRDIPTGFAGIWENSSGQVVAILGLGHPSQIRFNGFEYEIHNIGQVDDGSFLGSWLRIKVLGIDSENTVHGPNPARVSDWAGDVFSRQPDILEAGDFRFTFGRPWTDGSIHSLNISVVNEDHHAKISDLFNFDFDFNHVSFANTFKAPHYSLQFSPSSDNKNYDGILTYNEVAYTVHGVRTGIRLGFVIQSREFNRKVGAGYVDWTPSQKRLEAIKNGDAKATDCIYAYIGIPSVLPSGGSVEMKER